MRESIYDLKADFFKTLAHPARIRVLELLRDRERSVSELIPDVGLEASHLSQQLGVLRRADLIRARKAGSLVFYSVRDRRIFALLEQAKLILTGSLTATHDLLTELENVDFADRSAGRQATSTHR